MSATSSLEKSLGDAFKNAPKLPEGGKKWLVKYLPWINLVIGVLSLWAAYSIWRWAHVANDLINYANEISRALGTTSTVDERLTVGIWLALAVLSVEGILYIAAFPGTRDRKKIGWNLMFYALLINVVYSVLLAFTAYGGLGNLIGGLIGSAIGLYLLFQIRDAYSASGSKASVKK